MKNYINLRGLGGWVLIGRKKEGTVLYAFKYLHRIEIVGLVNLVASFFTPQHLKKHA